MTTQERIKKAADENGHITLSGAGEYAAARALERKGLIKIDTLRNGRQRERHTIACSLAKEWV